MSYPKEFTDKVRVLYVEKFSLAPKVAEELLTGKSKELAESLKLLALGPSPSKIIELLNLGQYYELRILAVVGVSAGGLIDELRQNWRRWCPDDPPGHFRASAFNPDGELVELK